MELGPQPKVPVLRSVVPLGTLGGGLQRLMLWVREESRLDGSLDPHKTDTPVPM